MPHPAPEPGTAEDASEVGGQWPKLVKVIAGREPVKRRDGIAGRVPDHLALLKPRVMSLVVFTGGVGMAVAPGHIDFAHAVATLVCMAAGAGGCGALNMWYDADIDGIMQRTAGRPIPANRVAAREALITGTLLCVLSVLTLGLLVNAAAAGFLGLTIAIYVPFYTMFLKRRTAQNIVLGGAAGALPPVIGWAAVTGSTGLGACRCSSSSFSGRRRISGRSRSAAPRTTSGRASRCFRWSRGLKRLPARYSSTRLCSLRLLSCHRRSGLEASSIPL